MAGEKDVLEILGRSIAPTIEIKSTKNIRIITISNLIGSAIQNIALEKSISTLFN